MSTPDFSVVAKLYDQFRPRYPMDVYPHVVGEVEPGKKLSILESGCGTGQASQLFVDCPHDLVLLDPAKESLDIAGALFSHQERKPELVAKKLEDYTPGYCFDLIVAVQSLHWVAEDVRYATLARLLKEDGRLLMMRHTTSSSSEFLYDSDVVWHAVRNEPAPEKVDYSKMYEEVKAEWLEEFESSGLFSQMTLTEIEYPLTYDADSYLGLLQTYSGIFEMDESLRAAYLEAMGDLIRDKYVGSVTLPNTILIIDCQR